MKEMRIHARAGQGAITTAALLGTAAFIGGKYALAFPHFGAERMGAKTIDAPKPVDEYLKLQGRYAHLFTERGKGEIAKIQAIADSNIKKYGPLKEGKGVREKMVEEKFTEEKIFTTAELSKCDAKEGRPAYFAYKGKVYETTGSDRWADGTHYNK